MLCSVIFICMQGLTPEEIDAYMAQQEAKREQQQAA